MFMENWRQGKTCWQGERPNKNKGGKIMKSKWLISVGLVVCLVLTFALPMCAPTAEEAEAYEDYVSSLPEGCEPVPRDCFEQAMEEGQLNIYNWAEWWPEEIFTNFEEEFGIKITLDYFGSAEEMVAKIKLNPEADYDLASLGMVAFWPLKELGLLKKINWDWLPNANKYGPEEVKKIWRNLGAEEYSVFYDLPYQGLAYNVKYVKDPIPSWGTLLEPDEKYKGRITMIDDTFETIGAALKYLGYSINSDDEEELMEAKELLLRQKPYVMAYDSWPKRLLFEEEAWMSHTWTGDAWAVHKEKEDIRTLLPEEGTILDLDGHYIPVGGTHPAASHLFLNYIFRPEVNALLFETIGYTPAHTASPELLSEGLRNWPGTVVSEEYLAKCEAFSSKAFTGKGLELRSVIWEELKR